MERTRTSIWSNIIDSIKALANTEIDSNGKFDEEKLTQEEKKELAKIREMDKVKSLEERANLRKRYGATVDEAKANRSVKKSIEKEEKTISK